MSESKLRGVNLGGWLVLERWITPSLFEGTDAKDEFSFMQTPDASEKIKWHRRTFIMESDFAWLADHGVNAVRIPVGYWLFAADEPFTPCAPHLDWAMEMAGKYNLKVLIDVHAAKGSQNGKDHSGKIGKAAWFMRDSYRQETTTLLRQIAQRYKNHPALWGIELLNEPKMTLRNYFILKRFYKHAYDELARELEPGTYIVYGDAFMPRLLAGAIKGRKDYPVAMDVHWYQFGKAGLGTYFKKLVGRAKMIDRLQRRQPIIVGEWSGMLSRRTLAGHTETEQAHLQKVHIAKQLEAYGGALGWFYWTYTTEAGGIWDFKEQVEGGNLLLR